jgi:YesN/AraC family two-component response regulator
MRVVLVSDVRIVLEGLYSVLGVKEIDAEILALAAAGTAGCGRETSAAGADCGAAVST